MQYIYQLSIAPPDRRYHPHFNELFVVEPHKTFLGGKTNRSQNSEHESLSEHEHELPVGMRGLLVGMRGLGGGIDLLCWFWHFAAIPAAASALVARAVKEDFSAEDEAPQVSPSGQSRQV